MNARTFLLGALALAACEGKEPTPAPPNPSAIDAAAIDAAPVADAACKQQVADFATWMKTLAAAGRAEIDFFVRNVEAELPAAWIPEIDMVEMKGSFVDAWDATEGVHEYTHGRDDKAALEQRLAETLAKQDQPGAGDSLRVDIDRDCTWGQVVDLVDAATKAGYHRLAVVFKAKPPLPRPEASSVRDRLMAGDSSVSEEVWERCPQVRSFYIRRVPGDRTARELREEEATAVPAAVEACACAVDWPQVYDDQWMSWVGNGNGSHRAAVMLDLGTPGIEATVIKQPAKMPWSEASAAIIKAGAGASPVKLTR